LEADICSFLHIGYEFSLPEGYLSANICERNFESSQKGKHY